MYIVKIEKYVVLAWNFPKEEKQTWRPMFFSIVHYFWLDFFYSKFLVKSNCISIILNEKT